MLHRRQSPHICLVPNFKGKALVSGFFTGVLYQKEDIPFYF